mmetsp:Transcript_44090/g.88990  ORF Transcript_44090/g.88990 Transcript_44090/m.88990 type:complete len:202 (+) Transcript_44090:373-978(+)
MARRTSLPLRTTKHTLATFPRSPAPDAKDSDSKDSELREAKRVLVGRRLPAMPSEPGTRTRMTRSIGSMLPKWSVIRSPSSTAPGSHVSAQAAGVLGRLDGKSAVTRPLPSANTHMAPSSSARDSCTSRSPSLPGRGTETTSPETRPPSSSRASTRTREAPPAGSPNGSSPLGQVSGVDGCERREEELLLAVLLPLSSGMS